MKLFVIDFSKTSSLADKLTQNHEVFIEKKDGQRAYKLVGEILPDLILVNYSYKPSHGRQTAMAIRKRIKTSHIPIYFVDGSEVNNKKSELIGKKIRISEIESLIAR